MFFFDTPEVTKIVLPKVLQNLKEGAKLHLLDQGTEPEKVFVFLRNIQYRARPKGPSFQFFGIVQLFFLEKFFP